VESRESRGNIEKIEDISGGKGYTTVDNSIRKRKSP
jgi:hypothetical protein